jgi:uncharacterized protein YndB with AHSA1/START domain
MTDLVIERMMPAPLERVFDFVTRSHNVLGWFGPEGATLPEAALDFSRPGPWFSVFLNADGSRYKVSGQVTRVVKPNLVAFTWGWHDDSDRRGSESHVMIELSAAGDDQTRLVVRHADLPDEAAREAHARGWNSTLNKLERFAATAAAD